jgi:hypothetical protein
MWYDTPYAREEPKIRPWHKWACILHAAQALIIMILITSGTIPHTAGIFSVTRQTSIWTQGVEKDSQNIAMIGNYTVSRSVQPIIFSMVLKFS